MQCNDCKVCTGRRHGYRIFHLCTFGMLMFPRLFAGKCIHCKHTFHGNKHIGVNNTNVKQF